MGNQHRLSPEEISRLLQLVSSLADEREYTPSEAIDLIAQLIHPTGGTGMRRSLLADYAERVRRLRLRRNALVGAPLFRDPAWDMLLALFAAHERGRKVSVSSLCYASGVPLTTALRQIARLEEHGLIIRHGDGRDSRRALVEPTETATAAIISTAQLLLQETLSLGGSPAPENGPEDGDAEAA